MNPSGLFSASAGFLLGPRHHVGIRFIIGFACRKDDLISLGGSPLPALDVLDPVKPSQWAMSNPTVQSPPPGCGGFVPESDAFRVLGSTSENFPCL